MKIVLATGNRGKIREIKQLCRVEVSVYSDILGAVKMVENGDTFAANAVIKAKTVYEKLPQSPESIVIADDSGLSVDALDGKPNIHSARFAGVGATDKENLEKLIVSLKERGVTKSPAHYTAAIAIVSRLGTYVVHGWMHGEVTTEPNGEKGFGYDPLFIPHGYTNTLGELDDVVKQKFSHRAQALRSAKPIIEMLKKYIVY
jgi:XTP/dITP diphosphohydrolase